MEGLPSPEGGRAAVEAGGGGIVRRDRLVSEVGLIHGCVI